MVIDSEISLAYHVSFFPTMLVLMNIWMKVKDEKLSAEVYC